MSPFGTRWAALCQADAAGGPEGQPKLFGVHDPGKVVLDLALSLALGGDHLADVGVLRAEPGVYGLVASDPTVSRTLAVLAADVPAALAAINTARAAT